MKHRKKCPEYHLRCLIKFTNIVSGPRVWTRLDLEGWMVVSLLAYFMQSVSEMSKKFRNVSISTKVTTLLVVTLALIAFRQWLPPG